MGPLGYIRVESCDGRYAIVWSEVVAKSMVCVCLGVSGLSLGRMSKSLLFLVVALSPVVFRLDMLIILLGGEGGIVLDQRLEFYCYSLGNTVVAAVQS